MAFLVDASSPAAGEQPAAPHPLSPRPAAEIETASAAVKAIQQLNAETARFGYISLYEPAKHDVIAFGNGTTSRAPDRLAKVVLRERAERATYETVVRLTENGGEVVAFKRGPGVQPSVMLEEFLAAEDIVRNDPRWQDAMRKRGIANFDLCMIDPWSTPNVEPGVGPTDGRFVSPLTWVRADTGDNGYAHPIENVRTLVDLDTLPVVTVEDDGVVPIPTKSANYSAGALTDPNNVPYFPDGPKTDVNRS